MTRDVQPNASHYIGGRYTEDEAGSEIACVYPYDQSRIASLHEATPAIIEKALSAAAAAQKEWAAMPGIERGRILQRAAASRPGKTRR